MSDFIYDEERVLCICPAGHKLYQTGRDMRFNGYRVDSFRAPITACRDCHHKYCVRSAQR